MKKFFLTVLFLLTPMHMVLANTSITGSVNGTWMNPVPDGNSPVFSGVNTSFFEYGDGSPPNSLSFQGNSFDGTIGEKFSFGILSYYNGTTDNGTSASQVSLKIIISFVSPDLPEFQSIYNLDIVVTENNGSDWENADYVFFRNLFSTETFEIDGASYKIQIIGFSEDGGASTVTQFHVLEDEGTSAELYAKISKTTADSDSDGVIDEMDECPDTELDVCTDNKGCPCSNQTTDCEQFDANKNNRIDLSDVIYGLQVLSGQRNMDSNFRLVECAGSGINDHCIPDCGDGSSLVSHAAISSGGFWTHVGLCADFPAEGYKLTECTGDSIDDHCVPDCGSGWKMANHIPVSSVGYWTHVGLCTELDTSEYKIEQCTGTGINGHCIPDCGNGWQLINEVPVSSGGYWTHIGLCKIK